MTSETLAQDGTSTGRDDDESSQSLLRSGQYIPPTKEEYHWLHTFNIFFFPALGGLLFGYDIGATSSVVSQLTDSDYSGVRWTSLVSSSSLMQGVITSMMMLGALFGSMMCFKVADGLGRRRSLILGSVLYAIGAIVEYVSGNTSWGANTGITVLLFGRLVYGIACGFAMHGAPAYIGEMAPASIRGLLVSMKEVFIVLGMLLGYSIGYAYSEVVDGWRVVYAWSIPVSVIMCVGMIALPYSARWLALQGRFDEAKQSMLYVLKDVSNEEFDAIVQLVQKVNKQQQEDGQSPGCSEDWRQLSAPGVWEALVAGVGLVIFQQITGQPSVLYYAVSILEDIGLTTSASMIIAGFKLVATSITTFTVDKFGRKSLLLIGCASMLVALTVLTITFSFTSIESDDDASGSLTSPQVVILLALLLYIGGYQIGFGPISWLFIAEVFPLEVRGKAVSIAVVMNFFWNTVMTLIFASELSALGASWTFFIYLVILIGAILFIYEKVPETKGLTLEQIESKFLAMSQWGDTKMFSGFSRDTSARDRQSILNANNNEENGEGGASSSHSDDSQQRYDTFGGNDSANTLRQR